MRKRPPGCAAAHACLHAGAPLRASPAAAVQRTRRTRAHQRPPACARRLKAAPQPSGGVGPVGAEPGGAVFQYVLSHANAAALLPNTTFDAFSPNQVRRVAGALAPAWPWPWRTARPDAPPATGRGGNDLTWLATLEAAAVVGLACATTRTAPAPGHRAPPCAATYTFGSVCLQHVPAMRACNACVPAGQRVPACAGAAAVRHRARCSEGRHGPQHHGLR